MLQKQLLYLQQLNSDLILSSELSSGRANYAIAKEG